MISDGAHENNIWVGVCGEMAGDIVLTPLLLGLGMDELSASASLVPRVKLAVQRLSVSECRQLVAEAMQLETPDEILERCQALAQKHYPRSAVAALYRRRHLLRCAAANQNVRCTVHFPMQLPLPRERIEVRVNSLFLLG